MQLLAVAMPASVKHLHVMRLIDKILHDPCSILSINRGIHALVLTFRTYLSSRSGRHLAALQTSCRFVLSCRRPSNPKTTPRTFQELPVFESTHFQELNKRCNPQTFSSKGNNLANKPYPTPITQVDLLFLHGLSPPTRLLIEE